jgi:NitT/TauT family transport system substrate-binding protein
MMMRQGKYIFAVSLVIFLIFQSGGFAADRQQVSKPTPLKAVVFPFLSLSPFFIAQEEGYFTEQNLDVEFVKIAENVAFTALARGELDVWSGMMAIGSFNAILRGSNIRFVAPRGSFAPEGCPFLAMVARKALVESGQLQSPAQLKGRNVAWYRGSVEEYFLDKVIQKDGLTIDDLTKITIPPPADMGAMEKGSLDLTVAGEPWVTRLVQSGRGVLWVPVQEAIPGFQFSAIMYGPNLLEKNPEAGKRFMVAYFKGVRQYNQGKTDRNLEIIAKYTRLDKKLLEKACWPQFRNDGRMNIQSIKDFQNWAAAKGYLDRALPEDALMDFSFVEYANNVLK